ncbi:MAG TPA: glycoside hydrolase family 15 protein [Kofleriaceae bacterium]|nr:glycoside hydrolase family 15 protein [Kofleriaceae bacterium]
MRPLCSSTLLGVALAATALSGAPGAVRAQAVAPHGSWAVLPWTNGWSSADYDTIARKIVSFREHVYAHPDAASTTRELAYDVYFGLRGGGQNAWLVDRPITDAGWDGARGIARVVQGHAGLRATQYWFSPFAVPAPVVIGVVDVENTTDAPLADAALFALANLHVGGGADGTTAEHVTWQDGAFEERGAAGLAVVRALPAPLHHAASPDNPYGIVAGGGRLPDTADSGVRDDAVEGYEWDLTGLAPGETRRFALVIGEAADGDRAALDGKLALAGGDPDALLAGARADWDAFFARAHVPPGLSADERAVHDRQLAVLRMGQIREPGRGHGAIVASLPRGMWNIAWVRDQAYATEALVAARLDDEAKAALTFLLEAGPGAYVCCDRDGGPWVGAPYRVSVVRYHGDGSEESDSDAHGPNIEFDGFGLTLAALADYVDATGDTALVTAHADAVFAQTADVLVGLVEQSGPAAGLVRADSSIWESHWYDGGRQHWTFTQATAVHGLRAAARLADRVGRAADAARYRTAADTIAAAIVGKLVDADTGIVRASLEQTSSYLDAAAIAALRYDVIPPDGATATATLGAFDQGLATLAGHGYQRNDDGGDYDRREWISVDMWMAEAWRRAGHADRADALVAWVTAQARLNLDVIPENYDRTTADYQGEIPMVGFGAGAYVSALWARGGAGPDVDAGVGDDAGPDGGVAGDGGGGGCCEAGGPTGARAAVPPSLLAAVALALTRRRRRRR